MCFINIHCSNTNSATEKVESNNYLIYTFQELGNEATISCCCDPSYLYFFVIWNISEGFKQCMKDSLSNHLLEKCDLTRCFQQYTHTSTILRGEYPLWNLWLQNNCSNFLLIRWPWPAIALFWVSLSSAHMLHVRINIITPRTNLLWYRQCHPAVAT